MTTKTIFNLHHTDARKIEEVITDQIVDVTITSPPYYNMKDYGYSEQIGFGQDYDTYLNDLYTVFEQVYRVTKDTGSLWVVINTFKQNREIVPLPFDFSNKIKKIGWKLHDIIIWNKDKTVPWSHKGQTQNKFEYILFFVKNDDFKYEKDRARDFDTRNLKKWWIKYPERYNPKGKSPNEVWDYPIPTQGSWGNEYIKHFCPLPTDMIKRMIQLTSDEKYVILDPFAGSGSVLAQAAYMKRNFIGFELNLEYIERFNKFLSNTESKGKKRHEILETGKYTQEDFSETILNLRSLKFARIIYKNLKSELKDMIKIIYIDRLDLKPKNNHKIITVEYKIYLESENKMENTLVKEILKQELTELVGKPPLSKYGIEAIFTFYIRKTFLSTDKTLYLYDNKITHKYKEIYSLGEDTKKLQIISPIKTDIDENDFE